MEKVNVTGKNLMHSVLCYV